MIASQLDKLEPTQRVMAIAEVIRRLTCKLHTEATKLNEGNSDEFSSV